MRALLSIRIADVALMLLLCLAQSPAASGQETNTAKAQVTHGSDSAKAPALQQRNPRYQLRGGDSFDMEFAFSPEMNQTVTIQPDGYVTAKVIGSLRAEGLTIPELTDALKTAYANTLHDPVITIVLKDFEKPYFIAAGQIGRPGKYDLRSDITVTEAVAIAGGFNDKAKHSQVVLFRPAANDMFEARIINVKKLMGSRDMSEDIHLHPGDMLFVPQNTISRIERLIKAANVGMYFNPLGF